MKENLFLSSHSSEVVHNGPESQRTLKRLRNRSSSHINHATLMFLSSKRRRKSLIYGPKIRKKKKIKVKRVSSSSYIQFCVLLKKRNRFMADKLEIMTMLQPDRLGFKISDEANGNLLIDLVEKIHNN